MIIMIGIDPGGRGAIAYLGKDGEPRFELLSSYWEETFDAVNAVCMLSFSDDVFVEDVGKHFIGNAAQSSIKLARNHQTIISALHSRARSYIEVSPQAWSKGINVQTKDWRTDEEKQRVKALPEKERTREQARFRKAKKDKKTQKIRAMMIDRWGEDVAGRKAIPDYAVDAFGILFYGEMVVDKRE